MTVTPDIQLQPGQQPGLAVGAWRLSPADSYASFAARLPLRQLRGRLPLTGHVLIAERVEESRALLIARTGAVRTGSQALDRVLAGPAFLDAGAFPDINFTSDQLVWVPSGWRAIGRLRVKNTEHEVACQFDVKFADPSASAPPRPVVCCRWALDSTWVTSQRIPGLDRRIEMTCSFELTADRQSDETSVRCDRRRTEMAASS